MIYLSTKEIILFTIFNDYQSLSTKSRTTNDSTQNIEISRKCGYFDLNANKWTEIASIKFIRKSADEWKYHHHYECCIDLSDDNVIYAVSNTDNVQIYDINKDGTGVIQWCEIVKDGLTLRSYKSKPAVWMKDKDIICVGNRRYRFSNTYK